MTVIAFSPPPRLDPTEEASGGGISGKMKQVFPFILPEIPRGEAAGRGAEPLAAPAARGEAVRCA